MNRRSITLTTAALALAVAGLAGCTAAPQPAPHSSAPSGYSRIEQEAISAALEANPDYSEKDVAGVDKYLDGYAVVYGHGGSFYVSEVVKKKSGEWYQLVDPISVGSDLDVKSQPKYAICLTLTKDATSCSVKLVK